MTDIKFYGTRGAFALSNEKYTEFGGATTCLMFNLNNTHIMVDCGSGVDNALDDLADIDELHLFISHNHIDHISGMVELMPFFKDKKLHIYSKTFNGISIREALNGITDHSLWPVSSDSYNNIEFHEIGDTFYLNDIEIANMDSNHPGGCSLFRFKYQDDDIVTAFDFCHLDGYADKLLDFAKGCKTLIYDGNMSEKELADKSDWGHSTPEAGAEIAAILKVEKVYITHYGVYDDETLSHWEDVLNDRYPFLTFARSGAHRSQLLKMVDVGTLLMIEKDLDKLLTKTVEAAMDITGADGGTLYQNENDALEFKVVINKSKGLKQVRKDMPLDMPAVEFNAKNVCAAAAREKKLINIEDCYKSKEYDFSGVLKYDELNNYKTKSVLVVPLVDDNNELIGVLQLINALDNSGHIVPFSRQIEGVVAAMANQAAMSIVNTSYAEKINDLLYGFVKVMSVGIDERTPYNANHTKNMIRFANKFFDYELKNSGIYSVDYIKRREILMSIWLHDVGKILTPLDIMNKNSRLGDLMEKVHTRYERRDLLLRLSWANNDITKEEYDYLQTDLKNEFELVNTINSAGFLTDELKSSLDDLAKKTYKELDGSYQRVINDEEYYQLCIVKGTLTKEERAVMENHVVMTNKLLAQLNFPKNYSNIPIYASNHHEFINGTGYPNHLSGDDLPWPCRLITICDIFEALIAKDRPYKKPMPVEKALSILKEMVDIGKLDGNIVAEFEKAEPWTAQE